MKVMALFAALVAAVIMALTVPASAKEHLLTRPSHGQAAVEALGERLPDAAQRNGMTAGELRELLQTDRTAWVDQDGHVFFVEPVPTEAELASTPAPQPTATAPLDQTFTLHSQPGSTRIIYLDFNGHTVSGTSWNSNSGLSTASRQGWSIDADPGFSSTELTAIQDVWKRVSEDFAPFQVDVTTQDPGVAALERSSASDTAFGTRVLFTDDVNAHDTLCPNGCGGKAYLGTFDWTDPNYPTYTSGWFQPAWVFPYQLGDSAKTLAEAASHEAGHNLGLSHDGKDTADYYTGHNGWAPIMGVGYYQPISQWSLGEYTGATQKQDDLTVISQNGLTRRSDPTGSTIATAGSFTTSTQYITTRGDIDVYRLGNCTGTLTLRAKPAAVGANLDIRLDLLKASGQIATNNPTSARISDGAASGLAATITRAVSGGPFYARVAGVGRGTVNDGYSDYASIGPYTLTKSCS